MTAPANAPLIGYPKAWTPGTGGVVKGEAVRVTLDSPADLEAWRGKLKGKLVLMAAARQVPLRLEAQAERYTEAQLADLARQPVSAGRGRGSPATRILLVFLAVPRNTARSLEPHPDADPEGAGRAHLAEEAGRSQARIREGGRDIGGVEGVANPQLAEQLPAPRAQPEVGQ